MTAQLSEAVHDCLLHPLPEVMLVTIGSWVYILRLTISSGLFLNDRHFLTTGHFLNDGLFLFDDLFLDDSLFLCEGLFLQGILEEESVSVLLIATCKDSQNFSWGLEVIFLSVSTVDSLLSSLGEEVYRNQDSWKHPVRLPYKTILDCEKF